MKKIVTLTAIFAILFSASPVLGQEKKTEEKQDSLSQMLDQLGKDIKKTSGAAWDKAKKEAGEAWDDAKKEAWEKAKKEAGDAWDKGKKEAGDALDKAGDWTKKQAKKLKE